VEELVKEPVEELVEERPFRAVKDVLQKTGFSPGSTISSPLFCVTLPELNGKEETLVASAKYSREYTSWY